MPPQISEHVDFECSFQKTKNSRLMCVIFDMITPGECSTSMLNSVF